MRIAAALPSLEPTAPHRRALDAMLARVVEAGHEVAGFAEHDRTEDAAPFPVFHYLRMPERHDDRAFDAALYPIGRDASPYQGVFALMHRYPGAVWFLDPIVHHFAVGGIALMDDWVGYRRLLDEAYGTDGGALAQTVASNWGTGALFRRYDLVQAMAAGQKRVLAAWPALADRLSARLEGREIGVVPLVSAASSVGRAAGGPADGSATAIRRLTIMTVNESFPASAVRVAAAALDVADDLDVRLCMSEPIHRTEGARLAERWGIEGRIDWMLNNVPERLAEAAADSDIVVWLAEELEGRHRLVLLDAMADGRITFVPRGGLYDDLPDGAVIRLDLGRTLPSVFGGLLEAITQDHELAAGLVEQARAFARTRPTPDEAAAMLVDELRASAAAGPVAPRPISRPSWEKVDAGAASAGVPGGAGDPTRDRVAEILRRQTEPFR